VKKNEPNNNLVPKKESWHVVIEFGGAQELKRSSDCCVINRDSLDPISEQLLPL
jgi:hypothetical protein